MLSLRGSILLDDESFFFFLEWQVDHLGFDLACLLSCLSTTTSSYLSASSASAVTAPLMSTTWASHSLSMHSKIWPQCVGSSSFGGSGPTCRVYLASVSGARVWFISGRSDLLQCGPPGSTFLPATLGTFLDMSFDSPPLVQPTATTDGTHEDHPAIESNVIHKRIPADV